MDFNKMMTENFSKIDEILKFFKHCCTVHEGIDCNKQDCDIFLYLDPIQKVLIQTAQKTTNEIFS